MESNWILWFVAAGVLVLVEIGTGTFYFLVLALCFAVGGLVAWLFGGVIFPLIAASVVGMIGGYIVYKKRLNKDPNAAPQKDPNMYLDIGERVSADNWESATDGIYRTRVFYRGAQWQAELDQGIDAEPGVYVIHEIRGQCLILRKP